MAVKYLILIFYFLVLFVIGLVASRRIRDIKDYYVGGKKLGYWVVAFSARATGESAWLLLALPGMGAIVGVSTYWVVVGEVIGVAVGWFVLAKPFKRLTDQYDSVTIPDYLVSRFGSQTHLLRAVAATCLSLFVIIYVSAQIDATGSAFEAFLGWNYYAGAMVGFIIVLSYIFAGGFIAVAWSDLFQGLVMFLGLVSLPLVIFFSLENSAEIGEELHNIDPGLLNIWGPGGFNLLNLMTLLGFFMIGLGFMGSPQVFVRFMSIKDESEINKGRWVAIVFTLLTDAAAVTIGILGRYFYSNLGLETGAVLGNAGQNIFPLMVDNFMPLLLIGFYLAAVLSAIMSTIDSLLVVASSAITRDFYQQIFHPNIEQHKLSKLSRWVTLIMAFAALAVSMTVAVTSPERTIFWFVIFGWSGIAATFCPTIILSLFWKNFTETAALASMITGFLSIPFFKFFMANLPEIGPYFEQLDVMFPSFVMAFLAAAVVNPFSSQGKTSSK